jgi:Raf kinase inhibitor-like YbhB/YbcL family protein
MKHYFITLVCLVVLNVLHCQNPQNPKSSSAMDNKKTDLKNEAGNKSHIILKSNSFTEGGMIPQKFTCQGIDISPQLSWENIPAETKSIAIICDDPDAPGGIFVHWVIFNIPSKLKGLAESLPKERILSTGAKQGENDFGRIGYGGPCPPALHRYFFKIYALNAELKLEPGIEKNDLIRAMEGHILAQGQLMGKYQKK